MIQCKYKMKADSLLFIVKIKQKKIIEVPIILSLIPILDCRRTGDSLGSHSKGIPYILCDGHKLAAVLEQNMPYSCI